MRTSRFKNKGSTDGRQTKENGVEQLRKRQCMINSINIQFAKSLRQSAITLFNDAYADYLDHFINQEKIKKSADYFHYDNEIIKGLKETKSEYLMKTKNIKKAFNDIDSNPSEQLISPEDIEKFAQQLYTLELNGEP